jgi:hypothetical protein
MQSSLGVAGMDALSDPGENFFDTSGKSPALFHYHADKLSRPTAAFSRPFRR